MSTYSIRNLLKAALSQAKPNLMFACAVDIESKMCKFLGLKP